MNFIQIECLLKAIKEMGSQIDLHDNGIGYNVNETIAGLGTQSAKNRVQILGGSLTISSTLGSGVKWNIGLPQD